MPSFNRTPSARADRSTPATIRLAIETLASFGQRVSRIRGPGERGPHLRKPQPPRTNARHAGLRERHAQLDRTPCPAAPRVQTTDNCDVEGTWRSPSRGSVLPRFRPEHGTAA